MPFYQRYYITNNIYPPAKYAHFGDIMFIIIYIITIYMIQYIRLLGIIIGNMIILEQ